MIYQNKELKTEGFNHKTAMQRYLYKYVNHKKEFHRLKAHEKDYAFSWMNVTYDEKGNPVLTLDNYTKTTNTCGLTQLPEHNVHLV